MAETKSRTRKKKEEVVEVVNEQPKRRKTLRELRRLLNRDTEVLVMNNTQE